MILTKYYKMKKYIIMILLLSTITLAFGQQDSQYTFYMYNTIGVNPAYAGSRGALSMTLLHRSQWVGLEGAPRTQMFSVHTPFKETRLGLGVSFVNDKLGAWSEQSINIDFSYTIPTSERGKLSLGLKTTGNIFALDNNLLNPEHANDPNVQSFSKFKPNFGIGAYYRFDKKWYVGISAPLILNSQHIDQDDFKVGVERTNYYLIGGYVGNLTDNIKVKPALLTKYIAGSPLQIDISLNTLIHNKFILGAAYRWSAAASLLAGFQMSNGIMIGYGYDMDTTKLSSYTGGSHELILRFDLFNRREDITSPRFF